MARVVQDVLVVPTQARPYYSQRTRLDGRDFLLSFAWNQREERWYLSIEDDVGDLLLAGLKLISNWPLLHAYQSDPRLPPGELVAFDLTEGGDETPPGFDDFAIGKRVELTYFAVTEQ